MLPTRSTGSGSSADADDATHYVLGGEHLGTAVATRLRADDHVVKVVDESYDSESFDVSGFQGDPTDVHTLETAGVADASTVVVATESDSRNLLIAQHVRANFDVPRIVVLVNAPCRVHLLEDAGHEPICATTVLSDAITETI